MSEPLEDARYNPFIEIIPPENRPFAGRLVCDCCRQRKPADAFDRDAFGICDDCICSDAFAIIGDVDGVAD